MTMIAAGDRAPDFQLAGETGPLGLGDHQGKKLVLYFYPKADTPGCTVESKDFSALRDEFSAAGTAIIGVSRDSVAALGKFRLKHDLAVGLGGDSDGSVTEAYGVWVEKSMYGKRYMGIERATFLIDRQGMIARVWHKVKIAGHAAEVLAAAQQLA